MKTAEIRPSKPAPTTAVSPAASHIFDVRSETFVDTYRDILARTYHLPQPEAFKASSAYEADIVEHTYERYLRFAKHVVPWVRSAADISNATVIEVGSGTGSATLAFAPHVGRILCYDIAEASVAAARERMNYFGVENVSFEGELFDLNCRFAQEGQTADVVLLVAVLEHMTFAEFETVLRLAWDRLRPGGIVVVAETPNRLSVVDYHTSWINFFQWLPEEIKLRYLDRSPREHFVSDMNARAQDGKSEALVRWGRGVSYHDFEIVLGKAIHEHIIADGFEDAILPIAPRFQDDDWLLEIFKSLKLPVNRAFARWFLYFIVRKPVA